MSRTSETATLIALGALAFGTHVAYPAALTLATRARREVADNGHRNADIGDLMVLIPAFREGSVIEAAVAQLRREGVESHQICVLVDGDQETADIARRTGVLVDFATERAGKGQAINRGVRAFPDAEMFLMMDANVTFARGTIARLTEAMTARGLDVASASKHEEGSTGEGLYWRFERHLVGLENRLGGSLAVVGELLAFRRSAFVPIPDLGFNDDQWIALSAALAGHRVGVVVGAAVHEISAPGRDQFERRTRMAANQFRLITHVGARRLLVGRAPIVMFLSHKVWRTSIGPAFQLAMTAYALTHVRSPLSVLVLGLNAAGVVAYRRTITEETHLSGFAALLAQAVGMPLVIGIAAACRVGGDPRGSSIWTKVAR